MCTRRPLLNEREMVAKRALQNVADRREWQLYCMAKFSDVIEVRKSGLDDDDFDYATRAHVDFLLTDSASIPQLIVEVDAYRLEFAALARAQRKDRIAHQFGVPLVRISVDGFDLNSLETQVEARTSEWLKDRPDDPSNDQCSCGAPLCFVPSCDTTERLTFSLRKKRDIEPLDDVVRKTVQSEYGTRVTFELRSGRNQNLLRPMDTYVAITAPGGISHQQLAMRCSSAKVKRWLARGLH